MAIPIIGGNRPKPERAGLISPTAPARTAVDLPPPGSAPEGRRPLGEELLRSLFAHEHPLVRSYAIEQASSLEGQEWSELIRARIADPAPEVAVDAIHALGGRKYADAAPDIAEHFRRSTGGVAAVAASVLGNLAPQLLFDAVKDRGRLDDEAYAVSATALAATGTPEVLAFLESGMTRQGALTGARRSALYGAVLLSGSAELARRVFALACADSREEAPEGASHPSRAAFAAVAGIPAHYARHEVGLEVFDFARTELLESVAPVLGAERSAALVKAVESKNVVAIVAALEPVLDAPESEVERTGGAASMPRRRRGLLRAMIGHRNALERLELRSAALFLAVAAQAAIVVLAGEDNDATSPALIALAKALETPSLDASRLAAMSLEELTALFAERTERQMRRVHNIVTHEATRRPATLERLGSALIRAGHAQGLFEAAADCSNPRVEEILVKVLGEAPGLEGMIVEALSRSPFEPKLGVLALRAADQVRTERVALAVGRRFDELRAHAPELTTRAILRLGDPRLLPLLEARAFADEPEEVAWALLAMVHGVERTEKLSKAIERSDPGRPVEDPGALQVRLRCTACGETLGYTFERAILDLDGKDPHGDPAWIGDTTCKACGVEDHLEPTEDASRVLTTHMLELLEESRRGPLSGTPRVAPGQTSLGGKLVGMSAALRALDREVAASPGAIRPRLHRARLRLTLKRRHAAEDLEVVLAADPRSAEALSLLGALRFREGDPQAAMALTASAVRILREPGARVYDATNTGALLANLEDYLVELELSAGVKPPEDLDLVEARRRRAELAAEQRAELERAREAASREGAVRAPDAPRGERALQPEERELSAAVLARAGRNDPCPCGSGKKLKKCHGRRG